jgi:mono/diheme cytochrome c family protein
MRFARHTPAPWMRDPAASQTKGKTRMVKLNPRSSQPRRWRESVLFASVAALFLTVSLSGISQEAEKPAESAPPAAATGAAKKGAQIFNTRCIICHNKQPGDNSPFGPPNLFIAFKTQAITPPQAQQIITHGKGLMPAFATILTKGDMANVIAYLKAGK